MAISVALYKQFVRAMFYHPHLLTSVLVLLFSQHIVCFQTRTSFGSQNAWLHNESSIFLDAPYMVCYLPHRNNFFFESSFDPFLCSHIITGFAGITNNELYLGSDEALKFFKRVINLKKINPELKILITVGGTGGFRSVVSSPKTIASFSKQAVNISTSFGFDGIDLDWEFPGWGRGSNKNEKKGLKLLLQALRQNLGSDRYLSAAVAAPIKMIDSCYDAEIHKHVNFLSVMCYDYHYFQDVLPFTGHNSPLYSRPDEEGYFSTMNINASIYHWLSLGIPKNKLVVGIPTYGHTFKLMDPERHLPGSVAVDYGYGKGWSTYSQTCKFLERGLRAWDKHSRVPYAFSHKQWVSFDDEVSLSLKVDYIRKNNLAGVMIWEVHADDFDGKCRKGTYPLLYAIKRALRN